jgi:phosphoglycolate phosphatase-like HAD superfamily hydrolase
MQANPALVLFDIDGTLLRRAGPHHRQALEDAVARVVGLRASIDGIPVAGMLDGQILTQMLRRAGLKRAEAAAQLPAIYEKAQNLYARRCPDLTKKVCPGVRAMLGRLRRRGAVLGLVTGNLSRIGWKKMQRAGLDEFFTFGAFAEQGTSRAALARRAVAEARRSGWVQRTAKITLVGDHPNDIAAARQAGVGSLAVATGLVEMEELATHAPDYLVEDLRRVELKWLCE